MSLQIQLFCRVQKTRLLSGNERPWSKKQISLRSSFQKEILEEKECRTRSHLSQFSWLLLLGCCKNNLVRKRCIFVSQDKIIIQLFIFVFVLHQKTAKRNLLLHKTFGIKNNSYFFKYMLTLVSRRFPVVGEESFCIWTLTNR